MSLYIVVFFIPFLIIILSNAFYLFYISRFMSIQRMKIFGFLPIVVLLFLSLQDLAIPDMDASLSGLCVICIFPIGLTNLLWMYSLPKK